MPVRKSKKRQKKEVEEEVDVPVRKSKKRQKKEVSVLKIEH